MRSFGLKRKEKRRRKMINKKICPYYEKRCKTCTHKGNRVNKEGKRKCIYNNQNNCPLYQEWERTKESIERINKIDSGRFKSLPSVIQEFE